MAVELTVRRVRVNLICPGAIATQIEESIGKLASKRVSKAVAYVSRSIPLPNGKPIRSRDVAKLVVFLASSAPSPISGTTVWIEGAGPAFRKSLG